MRGGIQFGGVARGDTQPTGGYTDQAGLPVQWTLMSFPVAFEPLQRVSLAKENVMTGSSYLELQKRPHL